MKAQRNNHLNIYFCFLWQQWEKLSWSYWLHPETTKHRAQTYCDKIIPVVVEDRLNFQLLSADSRVGQFEVDEEVLPDNHFQWFANADSWTTRRIRCGETEKKENGGWDRFKMIVVRLKFTESSPWVLDRLMPVNCQVVIESCKGTPFVMVVESLNQKKGGFQRWRCHEQSIVFLNVYFSCLTSSVYVAGKQAVWCLSTANSQGNWCEKQFHCCPCNCCRPPHLESHQQGRLTLWLSHIHQSEHIDLK